MKEEINPEMEHMQPESSLPTVSKETIEAFNSERADESTNKDLIPNLRRKFQRENPILEQAILSFGEEENLSEREKGLMIGAAITTYELLWRQAIADKMKKEFKK